MLTYSDTAHPRLPRPAGAPVLDLVVPVYNEERDLAPSVRRLHQHLEESFPYTFRITIADNASTDGTLAVAERLADELTHVTVVHLEAKGRGRALAAVWSCSQASVLAYTDVDLSTDLNGLLPLVAPLLTGHSDLAIGSRLAPGSRVVRGAKREVISRCYNLLLRTVLHARFSDAQCGFKAIRGDVAAQLLPLVSDTGWFFDTELLVLAERAGLRIHEVPVDWVDDPDSRVDIVATAAADLRGVVRVGRELARGRVPLELVRERLGLPSRCAPRAGLVGQLASFATIGALSTVAYLVLYVMFRSFWPAQPANLVALMVTAVANTAANRRLTFGVRGRERAATVQAQGLVVFAVGWCLSAGALALLSASTAHPGRRLELLVLVAANVVATAARFVLFRCWIFRNDGKTPTTPTRRAS